MINTIDVDHRPTVEQCDGCARILVEGSGNKCAAFAFPDTRWRMGRCSMATHIKEEVGAKGAEKSRVGQQKQKKR